MTTATLGQFTLDGLLLPLPVLDTEEDRADRLLDELDSLIGELDDALKDAGVPEPVRRVRVLEEKIALTKAALALLIISGEVRA